jgi:pteridine reductase
VIVHTNRHIDEARALAEELGGHALAADLTDVDAIDAIFAEIDTLDGALHVLVNNAAIFHGGEPETVTMADWDRQVAINLRAPFRCSQLAAPRLRATGAGVIVNLLDVASMRPEKGYSHYAATKAGLESLTHGLAVEWAPQIRVNGVAPGVALMPTTYTEAERIEHLARTPMGEENGAEAIADAVHFLIDGPRALNGVIFAVDGGLSSTW